MKVVVGLRNPGPDYEGTRHNIGAEVLVELARRHGERFRAKMMRTRSEIAELRLEADKVVLAAPMSYMNESGGPVSATMRHVKADVSDLLVIHDDIDLDFGRLRLQVGGGSGGHNGIRSVEKSLGTREFSRLKVGVGRPPGRQDPAEFVLRRFGGKERTEADLVVADAADVVERWITDPARAQEMAAHRRPA
ncbi:MAG TPA: aminoacyl-tRNA hydrolase [Acidimicrobiia bacterium]|nr:aminoacyl-tRNA hydrolase [Acidimicrobiia bacterium]